MVLELRLPVTLQNHVVGQRVIQHQTVLVAVLRDVAHTGLAALADGGIRDVPALESDGAGRGLFEARNTVDQLALAVAVDTGNADDLARADVEADAADGIVLVDLLGTTRSSTSRIGLPTSQGFLSTANCTSRPTIILDSSSFVVSLMSTVPIYLPLRRTEQRSETA